MKTAHTVVTITQIPPACHCHTLKAFYHTLRQKPEHRNNKTITVYTVFQVIGHFRAAMVHALMKLIKLSVSRITKCNF